MASITRETVEAIVKIERIASSDAYRPTLNAIHFCKLESGENRIMASNGHIATAVPFGSKEDGETLKGHYLHASDIDFLKALLKSDKNKRGYDLGIDPEANFTLQGVTFYRAAKEYADIQKSIERVMSPPTRQLPVTIALNAQYLKDVIQAMDPRKNNHATITFDALNTTSPICVTVNDQEGPRSIIMPVRMTERDAIEFEVRRQAERLSRPLEAQAHTHQPATEPNQPTQQTNTIYIHCL